jgi:hypothetical protein
VTPTTQTNRQNLCQFPKRKRRTRASVHGELEIDLAGQPLVLAYGEAIIAHDRKPAQPADDARQQAQRIKPMPLSSTGEAANCELYNDNVYFFMTYGGHRIRCGITDLALEVLEPKLDRTTARRRLDAFGVHRKLIERMASEKFDKKIWERDGITILVRDADINTSAAST